MKSVAVGTTVVAQLFVALNGLYSGYGSDYDNGSGYGNGYGSPSGYRHGYSKDDFGHFVT